MTVTYDDRLRAAVIALRRGWIKHLPTAARLLNVPEDALRRALLT